MKLTTRQRRDKKKQQKLRAKMKKVKDVVFSKLVSKIDVWGSWFEAKDVAERVLNEELPKLGFPTPEFTVETDGYTKLNLRVSIKR